jgi:TRAP-type C4-dicarboxylate transport system permease small subunit
MAETIHRALDAVYLACIWGIFARYVLGTGSQWPEPISILLMVIFTFLGAAAAYRAGAHIAVVMLTERMSSGVRGIMAFAVNLLMVGMSAFMVFYGTKLCMGTWGQSIPELPWLPVGLTYVPVPLGGFVTLLFVLEFLFYGDQSQRAVVQFDLLPDSEEKAA